MVLVMREGATLQEIAGAIRAVEAAGRKPSVSRDGERTRIGVAGGGARLDREKLRALQGVTEIVDSPGFQRVARSSHPRGSTFRVGDATPGRGLTVIAGPCAVESEEQIHRAARAVREAGANLLRGGAFKPRTSPYSFQGLGREGLRLLHEAASAQGMACVSEVVSVRDIDGCVRFCEMLQVGARNMQNFDLLRELGRCERPVLLKRGPSATLEEFLLAAEYLLDAGNPRVILCERGIRTFETATRNTLDIAAVPYLKQHSHLPVFVDPSHAAGRRDLIEALALAAVAASADGLLIEVHPEPEKALSDGAQSLTPVGFAQVMRKTTLLREALAAAEMPAAVQ